MMTTGRPVPAIASPEKEYFRSATPKPRVPSGAWTRGPGAGCDRIAGSKAPNTDRTKCECRDAVFAGTAGTRLFGSAARGTRRRDDLEGEGSGRDAAGRVLVVKDDVVLVFSGKETFEGDAVPQVDLIGRLV